MTKDGVTAVDDMFGQLLLFCGLLLCSAFFSGSETALFSLSKFQLEKLEKKNPVKAGVINNLLSDQKHLLIAILLGNEFVNVWASVITATLISSFMTTPEVLKYISSHGLSEFASTIGVGISIGLMTFILLIFGEVTPKAIAMGNTSGFALFIARPVFFYTRVTGFLVRILLKVSNWLLRLFGISGDNVAPFITSEELEAMVSLSEQEGIIGEKEREMIDGIVSIGETPVDEIMTSRMEVKGIDLNNPPEDIFAYIREVGNSRLPVYEEHLDKIVGVLYVKDLLPFIRNGHSAEMDIRNVMREPFFVPENKLVDDLLEDMQRRKVPFAFIVDEYGGTEGIVTIEDIMEEIFGDIQDERDNEQMEIQSVSENIYIVDSKVSIEEMEELTGMSLQGEGYDTLGGYLFHALDRIPEVGDFIEFEGVSFKIESMDGNRILKVVISLAPFDMPETGKESLL